MIRYRAASIFMPSALAEYGMSTRVYRRPALCADPLAGMKLGLPGFCAQENELAKPPPILHTDANKPLGKRQNKP
jgi:hypothetical protein